MATIKQVQTGMARFIDNHIATAYTGIDRIVLLGGATLIMAGLPNVLKQYVASNPLLAAVGVYDPDSGFVDVDALYNAFVPHMGAEKLPLELPRMGKINLGTIKLGKEDIDTLVRYIREA